MIIDELMLYDFGIYAGQQSIKLTPPSQKKPVTIFYGLNGCGKTTILEALQIALFGQQAPFLEGRNYNECMSQRINKHSRYGQASLRLDFSLRQMGQTTKYRIYRVWKKAPSGIKETLEVVKDGHKSKTLSSNWHRYVEEVISAKLAHFFFFDGEKIEEYASEKGAQELLSTGLYRLLGVDLIDRAERDLATLRQRKLSENVAKGDDDYIKREIKEKQIELSGLEKQKEKLVIERAKIQTHEVDVYQRELDELDEAYKNVGGNLWERRAKIKLDISEHKGKKNENDGLIREVVSGVLPLMLVRDWFADLERHKKVAMDFEMAQLRYDVSKKRDEQALKFLREINADPGIVKKLATYLQKHREKPISQDNETLMFSRAGELRGFDKSSMERELDEASNALTKYIREGNAIDEEITHLIAEELSIPDPEDINKLTKKKHQAEKNCAKSKQSLHQIDGKLESLRAGITKVQDEIDTLMRKALAANVESIKVEKYVQRIKEARDILQSFSKSILKSKVEDVGRFVLESYQILLRKEDLLGKIRIDPDTLCISICGQDGKIVENSQLSAGERQLLSISILWGLAKASSKPFPVAVDTPFGRLDSTHRMKLVSNYFNRASHQVLLFSTDEEIVDDYFKVIKPSVGWIYRLDYDSARSSTEVRLDNGV